MYPPPRVFEVVFLTNYSDYCFHAIPAIAQMADDVGMNLTIAHAIPPGSTPRDRAHAQERLASFFPEADSFTRTERRVLFGTPPEAVRQLRQDRPIDLLLAPASGRFGLPRMGRRSWRCELMRETAVPIWSIGRRTELARVRRAPRNIACWMDFEIEGTSHVACAWEYARRVGARLHMLCALPDIDEGSVFLGAEPITANEAIDEIGRRLSWLDAVPEVHVAWRNSRAARHQLVRRCDAELLFLPDRSPGIGGWPWLRRDFTDHCPAPVVRVPLHAKPAWNLSAPEPQSSIAGLLGYAEPVSVR
jgi:hypothetical protein